MSERISTILVSKNNRLKELLASYLAEDDSFILLEDLENDSDLYNVISSLPNSLLIVDLKEKSLDFLEKISLAFPGCKIVGIKENPNVDFIVKAVRAGAKELLSYPIIKTEFETILEKVKSSFGNAENMHSKCKMITVFSNKGGIGKTSIAANLALELAKITKENVALIDLNFQLGDITTFLDIKPSFDISYMFKNLNSLNKDFLLSTMERYKNTSLYVLADPPYFKQAEDIAPKQVAKFFEVLKQSFSYIVVDTDSNFDGKTITTLDYSDLVLLVTIVNLPALRNCQRCLDLFEKLGYSQDKVQILINRYMENDEISLYEVKKLLQKNIYWKIPNNYFAMMASINKGVLLSELNPDTNVAKSYKELALHVSDSVFRNNLIKKFAPDNMRKLEQILGS